MKKNEALLSILRDSGGFVSGSELAERLGVTRASVWKYINSLKDAGYDIEAVTNRGYRLSPTADVITADTVREALGDSAEDFHIEILPECGSTNSYLKERAATLPEWHAVIAETQSSGRGRLGRSFFSPARTGLYMSVLLRPRLDAADAPLITTAAAVAVCRAIEELAGERAEIKWVNDIFVHGKKVCGILTEASFDMESGAVEYVVTGIGINVTAPEDGFPEELSGIAGAVLGSRQHNMRSGLSAAILRHLYTICSELPDRGFVGEYRSRNFLAGREVDVLHRDGSEPAVVLEVDDKCRLIVRYADGRVEALSSGEVSVRQKRDEG